MSVWGLICCSFKRQRLRENYTFWSQKQRDLAIAEIHARQFRIQVTSLKGCDLSMTWSQVYASIVAVISVLTAVLVSEMCGVGSPDTEDLKTWSEAVKNHTILLQYKEDGGFAFTSSQPCTASANTPKLICSLLAAVSIMLLLAYYQLEGRLDHLIGSNWRAERKTMSSYLKSIFGWTTESKRFQFLTNCYIFQVGFFTRDFRTESLLCGICFIKLYHIFRLYRLFTFRQQYNKGIIISSKILGVDLTRNEIPNSAKFTMKFAIMKLPGITALLFFVMYICVVSYLLRLAEAPFQKDLYINIWNPMTFGVGYGDSTPITLLGRTIISFAIAYSILYLSTVTAIFCDAGLLIFPGGGCLVLTVVMWSVEFNNKEKRIFLKMEEEQWEFENAKAAAIVIQRLWRGQDPKVKAKAFMLQRSKYRKWRERMYGEKCYNYLRSGEHSHDAQDEELRKTSSRLDEIESMARLREESAQKLQRVAHYLQFMQTAVGKCHQAHSKTFQQDFESRTESQRWFVDILTADEQKLIRHIMTVHQEVLADGSSNELQEEKLKLLVDVLSLRAFHASVELIHAVRPRLERLEGRAVEGSRKNLARIR
ncbi:hypothetical protein GUITHDRAFT_135232 [Guillardia theta CCMP2712]|uniref:Potassium channel domain-containing protein n=1 Tax=Guillardia theta (strain CCMP2712) TaxID=905079 RepID=L1JQY4_GUITC|nr:hypothetical protein GUITHDRAFT_135232 [Guillardia theta CCMP2712]EKX50605.1 hypothetical protein GUITHDRAFT_135232 [Guillardia theta CCMP2712]|eukprot:XP_005837585.1 hypothetical protein GUITHDRAFT_135232 [Guillardia theta CCMP2712]